MGTMAHILIVEDQESLQFLIRTILEFGGHTVSQAQDGGVALDMLKTSPKLFDLILLDLLMPKMDGFEFLSNLQNHPRHPSVIVLSTHSEHIPQTIQSMISGRIIKPFRRQALIDAVNTLLGKNSPRPEITRYASRK